MIQKEINPGEANIKQLQTEAEQIKNKLALGILGAQIGYTPRKYTSSNCPEI